MLANDSVGKEFYWGHPVSVLKSEKTLVSLAPSKSDLSFCLDLHVVINKFSIFQIFKFDHFWRVLKETKVKIFHPALSAKRKIFYVAVNGEGRVVFFWLNLKIIESDEFFVKSRFFQIS